MVSSIMHMMLCIYSTETLCAIRSMKLAGGITSMSRCIFLFKETSYIWSKNEQPLSILAYNSANIRHLSKFCVTLFWRMVHRCNKCSGTWQLSSGGRVKIENMKNVETFGLSGFQVSLHFLHLCTILQKRIIQKIYYRWHSVTVNSVLCWIREH